MDQETYIKYEQEINEIVESRNSFIEDNYLMIRNRYYNTYQWPELDPVRHEICLCLFFGLSQAAITLTNHLMESVLKNSLIIHHSKKNNDPPRKGKGLTDLLAKFSEGFSSYDRSELNANINKACSAGLITKDQKKHLHIYREKYRNAYSHSEKAKIFGERKIPIQSVKIEDSKIVVDEVGTPEIAKMIVGQGIVQAMIARKEAPEYFLDIDTVVREIRDKLFNYNYRFV